MNRQETERIYEANKEVVVETTTDRIHDLFPERCAGCQQPFASALFALSTHCAIRSSSCRWSLRLKRSIAATPCSASAGIALPPRCQADQLHPGKIRKKWAFPSFIIPVTNSAGDQPATFVLVEITIIASLDDQKEPPAEKKIFVRDIIYQFFQNKSLEDLRHFSLARGAMNKELRDWLLKQWPEAPIESIIFNQYHLS